MVVAIASSLPGRFVMLHFFRRKSMVPDTLQFPKAVALSDNSMYEAALSLVCAGMVSVAGVDRKKRKVVDAPLQFFRTRLRCQKNSKPIHFNRLIVFFPPLSTNIFFLPYLCPESPRAYLQ